MIDNIHKHAVSILAEKYGKDMRVINEIVSYPFKFMGALMRGDDQSPIRLPYLGVFFLRRRDFKAFTAMGFIMRIKHCNPDDAELHSTLDTLHALGKYSAIREIFTKKINEYKYMKFISNKEHKDSN